jgi:hypothetical protein
VNRTQVWPALLAVIAGLILIVGFSSLYTNWALHQHDRQACAELRILAVAPGAATRYDQTIKREYQGLYQLRCH